MQKRGRSKMKGTFSLFLKAKQHAARPLDLRSDVFCAGWAQTFSTVQVLRQHQRPPRGMHVSAVIFPQVSWSPKRESASSLLGLVQQVWGERHSGARPTPCRSFTSLLECRWGREQLEIVPWPVWMEKYIFDATVFFVSCPNNWIQAMWV